MDVNKAMLHSFNTIGYLYVVVGDGVNAGVGWKVEPKVNFVSLPGRFVFLRILNHSL